MIAKAGDETLAQRIRKEGRLHLDLLERFGEDLLDVVAYLEQKGIPHRDIKPDNLGITALGRVDKPHLILFDFSLSRAPAEQIRAGTPPYLEALLEPSAAATMGRLRRALCRRSHPLRDGHRRACSLW